MCPGSSDPFYIVTYYIKWVTISWTYCGLLNIFWPKVIGCVLRPAGVVPLIETVQTRLLSLELLNYYLTLTISTVCPGSSGKFCILCINHDNSLGHLIKSYARISIKISPFYKIRIHQNCQIHVLYFIN